MSYLVDQPCSPSPFYDDEDEQITTALWADAEATWGHWSTRCDEVDWSTRCEVDGVAVVTTSSDTPV